MKSGRPKGTHCPTCRAVNAERRLATLGMTEEDRELRILDLRYRRSYGVGLADFDAIIAAQGGRCAGCGVEIRRGDGLGSPNNACLDHCHRTNRVRGALCSRCNTALGFADDNPETLMRLAGYVAAP